MGELRGFRTVMLVCALVAGAVATSAPVPAFAESPGRQLVGGPYSLTIRGGGENSSGALGVDARYDRFDSLVNVHLFGAFTLLEDDRGIGAIDDRKFGAGLAFSHTYPGRANAFVGTAVLREGDETFGHVYLGGKWKLNDFSILSGAYGFGLGNEKVLRRNGVAVSLAESADWLKAGLVLVNRDGWKANAYYVLTDPGDLKISAVEGEISYPVLNFLTVGVNGNRDLNEKSGSIRNWKGFLFATYAYGDRKQSPIDMALERNNPAEYPRVVRRTVAPAAAGGPLAVSPTNPTATGCSTDIVTFTASGGTPPYGWSTSDDAGNLTVISSTQARWTDAADLFCITGGTVTITLTDSASGTATATINALPPE